MGQKNSFPIDCSNIMYFSKSLENPYLNYANQYKDEAM